MWSEFEEGQTIGTDGTEGGFIVLDHELVDSARITIEKGGDIAPFTIVLGVYGMMFHTAFCTTEEEARKKTEELKLLIAKLLKTEDGSKEEEEFIDEIIGY